ncbi:MAG: TetR/AcrR family transcriptional regulator, cholesterol catabolism regulator [Micromonosporaceae bacterium]|jgi:AcrR family transcriptional regulator|nr:TetR/AcrR family transcriptional regulator, cholesterol catabolism regulator [Micromonosporaceae bacterium]
MAVGTVRREVILHAAAKLFAAKGVSASTVREIADAVGMRSGSLYHHFDSKASMVEAIIVEYLDDLRKRYATVVAANADPRSCLEALVRESLATVEAHPYATEIYQNDLTFLRTLPGYEYLRTAAADVQQTWLTVIKAGARAGVFRSDIQPEVFYRFIRDTVWLSVRWFKLTRAYPMSKLADDCISIFLDGFATASPTRPARRSTGPAPAPSP